MFVASAEDTVLAKLEWGQASDSERQLADVVAVMAAQELDPVYLNKWAKDIGVEDPLTTATATADERLRPSSNE